MNDLRQGMGTYTYPNGDTYKGEWAGNERHGQGTYTYASTGSRYEGNWLHGKMEGTGELIHANHRFFGSFVSGVTAGRGKYQFDIGCEQKGRYDLREVEVEGETNEDTVVVTTSVWKVDEIVDVPTVETF